LHASATARAAPGAPLPAPPIALPNPPLAAPCPPNPPPNAPVVAGRAPVAPNAPLCGCCAAPNGDGGCCAAPNPPNPPNAIATARRDVPTRASRFLARGENRTRRRRARVIYCDLSRASARLASTRDGDLECLYTRDETATSAIARDRSRSIARRSIDRGAAIARDRSIDRSRSIDRDRGRAR
jgi:hypothetical protein